MEPETRYAVIGAVVLALIGAAVVGFLWLSSSGRGSDFRYFTVYFEKQSLDGLQVGGSVNMRGITVGRVEGYTLGRDQINRVNVTVRVTRDTPVRQSTKASVSRNVVTGIARINLTTPGEPSPPLVAVASGERYPVIAEGTSNLDQIADSVNHLSLEANKALENLNVLLATDNQKAVAALLANIRDLSNHLNSRVGHLDKAIKAVDESALAFQRSTRDIAHSVQRVAGSVEPLTQEAGNTLREAQTALREFANHTRALETNLSAAVQRLETSSNGLLRNADDTLDNTAHELRVTASELRDSAQTFSRTLDRLQDPRAALLGPSARQLGPGEVRP